jgi:hypothetical protein
MFCTESLCTFNKAISKIVRIGDNRRQSDEEDVSLCCDVVTMFDLVMVVYVHHLIVCDVSLSFFNGGSLATICARFRQQGFALRLVPSRY